MVEEASMTSILPYDELLMLEVASCNHYFDGFLVT